MKSDFLEVAFFILHAIKCQFPSLKNNPYRGSLRTLEGSPENPREFFGEPSSLLWRRLDY